MSQLEVIEREVHDYMNDALNVSEDAFIEFKSKYVKVEANLNQYEKENQQNGVSAFKVYTGLTELDNQMRELYENNRMLKSFVESIKKIDFNVHYSRSSLLDSIKFGQQSTLQIITDHLDKHELARSYTEADLDVLRRADDPPMFNSTIGKSFRENSMAHSEVYGAYNDRRRTGSLLKSQSNYPTPNYLYLCNLDKTSMNQSSQRKLSESYDIESRATGMPTVHSLASLNPVRQNTDPGEKPRPPLNLYDKQRMTAMKSPKNGLSRNESTKMMTGELQRTDSKAMLGSDLKRNESKKGILNDFMSNSTAFHPSDKSTLTIRNLTMNQAEFKKAIFDALKKNKLIERIDLRDNVLPFDVPKCIKEMFGVPLVRPLSFDLRRNKVKLNVQSLETMKAQLSRLNVTIIV